MSTTTFILLLVALGVAALLGVVCLFVTLLLTFLIRLSGWPRLAELYPARPGVPAPQFVRQTAMVGPVQFRRGLSFGLSPQGLLLSFSATPPPIFRPILPVQPPLLIPWQDLKVTGERLLYWRSATVLSIGDPQVTSLTIFTDLLAAIRPYLAPPM